MNYEKVLTEEIKDMIKKDYIENFFSISLKLYSIVSFFSYLFSVLCKVTTFSL